jgi:RNase H-fold protein (predicted Holliday junction resolvase)
LDLDVGDQWIGVAHASELVGIVFPYRTWQAYEFVKKFTAYLKEHQVQTAVIGFPLTLKGNESQQTEKVRNWVELLCPLNF